MVLSNKRKNNDSITATPLSRAVIYTPHSMYSTKSNRHNTNETDIRNRMNSILKVCNENKDILVAEVEKIKECETKLSNHLKENIATAESIKEEIDQQIAEVDHQLENETTAIKELQEKFAVLQNEGAVLNKKEATLREECVRLRKETAEYEQQANVAEEQMEAALEKSEYQCKRLQHQISLYAHITGIKWDFQTQEQNDDASTILVGEVNIPSQNTVRRFEIDTLEHSPFDVANYFWDMMDGKYVDDNNNNIEESEQTSCDDIV